MRQGKVRQSMARPDKTIEDNTTLVKTIQSKPRQDHITIYKITIQNNIRQYKTRQHNMIRYKTIQYNTIYCNIRQSMTIQDKTI